MYFQINFFKKSNRWYIIILSNTLYSKKKKKKYIESSWSRSYRGSTLLLKKLFLVWVNLDSDFMDGFEEDLKIKKYNLKVI
jgi:hypothetical protein